VRVSVADLNGPRGGVDKRCLVAIVLIPSETIVIEERDPNIYVAIDRVGDRAGTCIGRRLKRGKGRGQDARISELLS
jgi:ribosome-associated translation inhibitor RaiA